MTQFRFLCVRPAVAVFTAIAALLSISNTGEAQSLRGSAASLDRQNAQAAAHDFTFIRNPQQLRRFVDAGYLVEVIPNDDFEMDGVSFTYARPEVELFIRRLASQYRAACGERLVVTSLTRPLSYQLPNASDRSVHPTGMAMDLRRSLDRRCRSWLERTLLSLEATGVLDATREHYPPHYHVALFPRPYATYVARITRATASASVAEVSHTSTDSGGDMITHTVERGESLWGIARTHGISESELRAANGLRGNRIFPGQQLRVPVANTGASASSPILHRVVAGESLWSIARQYGASVKDILAVNHMDSTRIYPDQVIEIPAGD